MAQNSTTSAGGVTTYYDPAMPAGTNYSVLTDCGVYLPPTPSVPAGSPPAFLGFALGMSATVQLQGSAQFSYTLRSDGAAPPIPTVAPAPCALNAFAAGGAAACTPCDSGRNRTPGCAHARSCCAGSGGGSGG